MEGNVRITIPVEDRSPVFSLCRKAELLGTVPVDHWWMQTTALYAQRARRAKAGGNFHAVTSAFWALCGREGARHEPETQESYLLARLVPFARNQGSRRVFADACLDPPRCSPDSGYLKSPEELEPLLHSTRTKRMSRLDFQRTTGDALGPPQLDNDATTTYRAFCEDLFAPARELLPADEAGAVERVIARWQWWMGSIGRRGGQARQKLVLDVLSYEARAALHRCYSAAWDMLLLPHLQKHYRLSPASVTFLRLWHLDQAEESNLGEQALFHLFHGHVFGLHPVGGLLMRSPTGRSLLGQWARSPTEARLERLLHAVSLAAYVYSGRREQAAFERRKQPLPASGSDALEQAPPVHRPRRSRPQAG